MVRSVVTPLIEKTRIELRYVRGMRCMHAERYLVYLDDLKAARQRGDWAETRRIIASLSAFSGEMRHLVRKHRSACDRLLALKTRRSFANESSDAVPGYPFEPSDVS